MEVFANSEKKLYLEERNSRFHYHASALLNSKYNSQIRNITNMVLGCWLFHFLKVFSSVLQEDGADFWFMCVCVLIDHRRNMSYFAKNVLVLNQSVLFSQRDVLMLLEESNY